MKCGTILHDKNYQFPNGTLGNKLVIVLCEFGADHLVLTTTSQVHFKKNKPGCQIADKPPNFFLPRGSCWFDTDTWVELQEVIELDSTIVEYKKRDGAITEHRDVLPAPLMRSILECALQSDFIDEFYREFLQKELDRL